jgi:hypothetical protein
VLHSHARLAAGHLDQAHQLQESERQGASHQQQQRWGIHPFYVPDARPDQPSSLPGTRPQPSTNGSSGSKPVTGAPGDVFELSAPTAGRNAFRVLRALSLRKAVLLEGSPGVGKTALVAALAKRAGKGFDVACGHGWVIGRYVWQRQPYSRVSISSLLQNVVVLCHPVPCVSPTHLERYLHCGLQCTSYCRCAAGSHQPVRADRHDGPPGS